MARHGLWQLLKSEYCAENDKELNKLSRLAMMTGCELQAPRYRAYCSANGPWPTLQTYKIKAVTKFSSRHPTFESWPLPGGRGVGGSEGMIPQKILKLRHFAILHVFSVFGTKEESNLRQKLCSTFNDHYFIQNLNGHYDSPAKKDSPGIL